MSMNLDIHDILGKIIVYFVIGLIGAIILMGIANFFSIIIYAKHLTMDGFRTAGLFGLFLGIIVGYINDNY